jgi:hypothetical protein
MSVAATRKARKRGNGVGSISRRKDGMWRGRVMVGYRADGKPDIRQVYAKTQKECQAKLDENRQRAQAGTLATAEKERDTVESFLSRWIETAKPGVRVQTWARYDEIVRLHLIPGLVVIDSGTSGPITFSSSTVRSSSRGCRPRPSCTFTESCTAHSSKRYGGATSPATSATRSIGRR